MLTITDAEFESITKILAARAIDHQSYRALHELLNDSLNRFARVQKSQFKPGDRVKWKDRAGIPCTGTICKINQKNIDIKRDPIIKDGITYPQGITRAHPSLLQRA